MPRYCLMHAAFSAACAFAAFSLRDVPIQSASPPLYLDGTAWHASEAALGLNISATVPGDIITDLQQAGVIPDPWYELTFLDNRSLWDISQRSWRFATSVQLPPPGAAASDPLLLVFEGVKMGAHVTFNGVELGVVTNQFVRYIFPLPPASLRPDALNDIVVSFDSTLPLDGRFTPCTGGWDWAPFSQLYINDTTWGPAATFSSGIWKSVYIVAASPLAITDVVPLVQYLSAYPVSPLTDAAHGGFQVNVTAHVWAPEGGASGTFTATGQWGATVSTPVMTVPAGTSTVTLSLLAPAGPGGVSLWWPNGLGGQPRYNVSVTWTPAAAEDSSPITAVRRIGFRVAALVTVNDTNATVVAESTGANGSGSFGMFFRINGAALYARGANLIPSEALEGRIDATAYHTLVQSAAAANMNMLRVWGGGIYPPDVFYDSCDDAGILLYHDMMFAGNGHDISAAHQPFSAATNASILAEISHQIRRLSSHPSLLLYDGGNEVIVKSSGPTELYASLVMAAVAAEDPSRILWPASPAAGWSSGVDRLWGTPNGKPLIAVGTGHIWDAGAERHGPYTAGVGSGNWSTIVRDPWSQAQTFNPGIPLSYLPTPDTPSGVGSPTIFASEFGTMSMSSFEAMSANLHPSSWSLHGGGKPSSCALEPGNAFFENCTGHNAMAQRNWPCDNVIWSYFGPSLLNATGETAFKGQLYMCLIASAIHMQLDLEQRRAGNNMGTLIWQLQETWSTGGWGSLEYGAPNRPGLLRGGRWKPVHHWLQSHLFQDVMSACGHVGRSNKFACYVNNARPDAPFVGTLSLRTVSLQDGSESAWGSWPVQVGVGPGSMAWVTPNGTLPNASTTLLVASLIDGAGSVSDEHLVPLAPPSDLVIPQSNVSATVAAQPNADGSINVTVSADAVALFVTLTAAAPGRFSDNAFFVLPSTPRVLLWLPFEPGNATDDWSVLTSSLRVEDMSDYVQTSGMKRGRGTM